MVFSFVLNNNYLLLVLKFLRRNGLCINARVTKSNGKATILVETTKQNDKINDLLVCTNSARLIYGHSP
jgi:hypothetical protein